MHHPRRQRLLGALIVPVALALPAGPATAQGTCGGASAATSPQELVRAARAIRCLVNVERRRRGLVPVRSSRSLRLAAARHSRAMLATQTFDHRVRGEAALASRVRATGYLRRTRAWFLGEALAFAVADRSSPAALVRSLMTSPAHRAIILDRDFREVGVGLLRGIPAAGTVPGGATLTLDFGRARR